MPFLFFVYIGEQVSPTVAFGTGFDPAVSLGMGSGARYITQVPLGFPLDRPLHHWQIDDLHNIHMSEVLIYHKHTPELDVTHMD